MYSARARKAAPGADALPGTGRNNPAYQQFLKLSAIPNPANEAELPLEIPAAERADWDWLMYRTSVYVPTAH